MLKRSVLLFLALDAAALAALYFLPYMVLVVASWVFVIGYIIWNEWQGKGLIRHSK